MKEDESEHLIDITPEVKPPVLDKAQVRLGVTFGYQNQTLPVIGACRVRLKSVPLYFDLLHAAWPREQRRVLDYFRTHTDSQVREHEESEKNRRSDTSLSPEGVGMRRGSEQRNRKGISHDFRDVEAHITSDGPPRRPRWTFSAPRGRKALSGNIPTTEWGEITVKSKSANWEAYTPTKYALFTFEPTSSPFIGPVAKREVIQIILSNHFKEISGAVLTEARGVFDD